MRSPRRQRMIRFGFGVAATEGSPGFSFLSRRSHQGLRSSRTSVAFAGLNDGLLLLAAWATRHPTGEWCVWLRIQSLPVGRAKTRPTVFLFWRVIASKQLEASCGTDNSAPRSVFFFFPSFFFLPSSRIRSRLVLEGRVNGLYSNKKQSLVWRDVGLSFGGKS